MDGRASNRQKKLLRFFGVRFSPEITHSAASWEIDGLMSIPGNRHRWLQYKFLTKDLDRETDELRPFSMADVDATVVPDGWDGREETERLDASLAASIIDSDSPYDRPEPPLVFPGRVFLLTGTFAYGTRKACQDAIVLRGGIASDSRSVSHDVNYLVIGRLGSPAWSRGHYGSKIERAVVLRRECGSPAIVSEDHWRAALA